MLLQLNSTVSKLVFIKPVEPNRYYYKLIFKEYNLFYNNQCCYFTLTQLNPTVKFNN